MKRLLGNHSNQLSDLITEAGLDAVTDIIKGGAYTRFDIIADVEEDYTSVGNSRFGGDPDLPVTCEWLDKINSLVFLYQISFIDLSNYDDLTLPNSGILYVFSDQDGDQGYTFYAKSNQALARYPMLKPDTDYIFSNLKALKLKLSLGFDLPLYGSEEYDLIEDEELIDEYNTFVNSLEFPDKVIGQLLGRAPDLNGDLRESAAEAYSCECKNWQSLWKVCSNETVSGLCISDCHVLHGLIRTVDLQKLNFSEMYSCTEVV